MIKEYVSHSEQESGAIAAELADTLVAGSVVAFRADLGCGKTLFTKYLAKALSIDEEITSPTFNLLEEYEGRLKLYHFDLYRIEHSDEFDMLAFEDYWEGDGVSVIEWSERAKGLLPDNSIIITIEYIDETTRRFLIEYPDS